MRRLDEKHNAKLLLRRPKVSLTPAVQALRQVLERERVMDGKCVLSYMIHLLKKTKISESI